MSTLYPVGFMSGRFHPNPEVEQIYVRTGRRLYSLDVLEFDLWSLAHTEADPERGRWTRADLLAAHLADVEQTDPPQQDSPTPAPDVELADAAIERMLANGLLVAVAERGADLEALTGEVVTQTGFSEVHRFRSLLGVMSGRSGQDAERLVGIPAGVVTALSESAYELWQVAGRADTLRDVAEQRRADAAERGEQLSTEDAVEATLSELRNLVSRGVGYFDTVPWTSGPLRYLRFTPLPIDQQLLDDLRRLGETQLPGEQEYRALIVGVPTDLPYLVRDPAGNEVAFAGATAAGLYDTIATLHGRSDTAIVQQAQQQLAAAAGRQIIWHVQQADDVASVRRLLQEAGLVGIEVRHTPSP